MKIKSIVLSIIVFMLFVSSALSAEEPDSTAGIEGAVYVNAFGHGWFYSAGGEVLVLNRHVGINAGFSCIYDGSFTLLTFPVFLSGYYGTRHRIYGDLGATIVYVNDEDPDSIFGENSGVMGVAGLGYNYNPPGSGFYFKIGPSIMFGGSDYQFWGGLSVGYSF